MAVKRLTPRTYDEMVALLGKAHADRLIADGIVTPVDAPAAPSLATVPASTTLKSFSDLAALAGLDPKPEADPVVRKLEQLGKNAARVWAWLQAHESHRLLAARPSALVSVAEIASALKMPFGTVAGAVISLAQNGLVTKLTQEGVAA